jgi:hypothetical protein
MRLLRSSSLHSVAAHLARIGCKAGVAYYASPTPNPNLLAGAVVDGPSDAFPDSPGAPPAGGGWIGGASQQRAGDGWIGGASQQRAGGG